MENSKEELFDFILWILILFSLLVTSWELRTIKNEKSAAEATVAIEQSIEAPADPTENNSILYD